MAFRCLIHKNAKAQRNRTSLFAKIQGYKWQVIDKIQRIILIVLMLFEYWRFLIVICTDEHLPIVRLISFKSIKSLCDE